MDVSKWKSVAIRKEVDTKFKKICKKEKRSPSNQLAVFCENYERGEKVKKKAGSANG